MGDFPRCRLGMVCRSLEWEVFGYNPCWEKLGGKKNSKYMMMKKIFSRYNSIPIIQSSSIVSF